MLVLASASPRRSTLLKNAGLDFIICPADNESNPDVSLPPEEYAVESAYRKASEVTRKFGAGDIILGADTIVYLNGAIIGKPKDADDAFRILKTLSGNTHKVFTGYTLIKGGKTIKGFEVTDVTFRGLEDSEIHAYIGTGEPMDKAGAYGVQGMGCIFVSRVNGDFYNVMGLPVCAVYKNIKKLE